MSPIKAYHRPDSLAAALELLARPGVSTSVLGGGTLLNSNTAAIDEVVDLQAAGLGEISWESPVLTIGATATLRDLVDHEMTPPLLRDLARRHAPNTIRNAATVGGTVASAGSESVLVAGLLALGAVVTVVGGDGTSRTDLAALLQDRASLDGRIITAVEVPIDGIGAHDATARTPADIPIVLVAGHRDGYGTVRLTATGLAEHPIQIDPAALEDLEPPSDFRGSAEYRRSVAATLAARVLARLDSGGGV